MVTTNHMVTTGGQTYGHVSSESLFGGFPGNIVIGLEQQHHLRSVARDGLSWSSVTAKSTEVVVEEGEEGVEEDEEEEGEEVVLVVS